MKLSRSDVARLLKTSRWKRTHRSQLREHPMCAMCADQGRATLATVCDHKDPHRGDLQKFWEGPFQSLCWSCHSRWKQQAELTGYSSATDDRGLPTDPLHPFYGGRGG